MTITLELSPETEEKALNVARSNGFTIEEAVRQLIENSQSLNNPPAHSTIPDTIDEFETTLWNKVQSALQKSWDSQPEGAIRRTSEIEAPCDSIKEVSAC